MTASDALKTTPLTAWHRAHGAKMVPFAGFEMPVQYEGVLAEHAAVRERVGLFDITHMGEIFVTGPDAEAWLDGLITNRITGVEVGKVTYTAMCRADGGVLDDMLVYRLGAERWLVVCNAANHAKIAAWLADHRPAAGVALDDASDRTALIAVQGPDSRDLVGRLAHLAAHVDTIGGLDFYTCFTCDGPGGEWLVSRTGYTGEHGYEIYLPHADAVAVWEELLAQGADLGVAPIGLAARDTLRFEVGYCLYGHELGEDITPLEAGIGWAMRLKKPAFVGKEALEVQKRTGVPRKLVCLEITGRGIARQDARVLCDGRDVGYVTSGTHSPTLKQALALALVASDVPADGDLAVDVRGKPIACRITTFPFLSARTKGDPRAERSLP
ncbi:glycine cleavage system aminomethyltransferase GcvT [bacterium]|nr:glycine cleavage system aminomethyltransferase GcvT [bacterium]